MVNKREKNLLYNFYFLQTAILFLYFLNFIPFLLLFSSFFPTFFVLILSYLSGTRTFFLADISGRNFLSSFGHFWAVLFSPVVGGEGGCTCVCLTCSLEMLWLLRAHEMSETSDVELQAYEKCRRYHLAIWNLNGLTALAPYDICKRNLGELIAWLANNVVSTHELAIHCTRIVRCLLSIWFMYARYVGRQRAWLCLSIAKK